MGKTRRRIATAATIAALGGLGAAAYESNPSMHATGKVAMVPASQGRQIVTSSSGATQAVPAVQSTGTPSPAAHRPVVTRASGAGRELDDD